MVRARPLQPLGNRTPTQPPSSWLSSRSSAGSQSRVTSGAFLPPPPPPPFGELNQRHCARMTPQNPQMVSLAGLDKRRRVNHVAWGLTACLARMNRHELVKQMSVNRMTWHHLPCHPHILDVDQCYTFGANFMIKAPFCMHKTESILENCPSLFNWHIKTMWLLSLRQV